MAYYALKKYFPDFDNEVRNANGRYALLWQSIRFYNADECRIQEYEVNAYAFGRKFLRIPKNDRTNVENPQCFWLSRDAYERLLRRLVLDSSKRIRWMVGTAINVRTNPKDSSILSAVAVRLPDGTEQDVPATFVVGAARYPLIFHFRF